MISLPEGKVVKKPPPAQLPVFASNRTVSIVPSSDPRIWLLAVARYFQRGRKSLLVFPDTWTSYAGIPLIFFSVPRVTRNRPESFVVLPLLPCAQLSSE